MTVKEIVREAADHAPENCSIEEILDDIRLRHELEISRQQSERGETLTLDEVRKNISQWAKNHTK